MLESLEGKRGEVRAASAAAGRSRACSASRRSSTTSSRSRACRSSSTRARRSTATSASAGRAARCRSSSPATSSAAGSSRRRSASRCASCSTTTAAAAPRAARSARCRWADRSAPTCPSRSSTRRSTTRRSPHRRAARPWRHRRVRRHGRHGADGALRDGVLRDRVVRQVHALPHRIDARRRGHRPLIPARIARVEPGPARRTLRYDGQGLAVRAGRADAVPVQSALKHFPAGLSNGTARPRSRRLRACIHDQLQRPRHAAHGPAPEPGSSRSRSTAQPVTVPDGTSIMRAAASAGQQIPKLCATDTLKAFGSCRLCLVEIEGRRGYPASCTTPVADGHEGPHGEPQAARSSAAA